MLLTLRGTPTIYYGDELAMPETPIPPERQVDPWGLQVPGLGRDGCRTPMQWDGSAGAGFTSGTPWLPLGIDHETRNVALQADDPGSPLSLYRDLLSLRRERAALRRGSYRSFEAGEGVFGYERSLDGEPRLAVVVGFGGPRLADVPAGRVVLSSRPGREGEVVDGAIDLAPDEAVVIERL
jgi:alpha-glucosidase